MRPARRLPALDLPAFRRLTFASVLMLGLIVVTGGAVRLTGSGLGCSTWPQCDPGQLVPPLGVHSWIEFGNRLVTLAVSIVVVVTGVGALLLRERRRDLRLLAVGCVLGVVAQAVIGGLSVRYKLVPGWVMVHFLASMLVLWAALALHVRAHPAWRPLPPQVRREVVWLGRALAAVAGVALVAGTVVTGTGPHAGDASAVRLDLPLTAVTQAHADVAFLLTGLLLATVLALRLAGAPRHVQRWSWWLVVAVVGQVVIGEAQYLLHLPAGLVGVHIAMATVLWSLTVMLNLSFTAPAPAPLRIPEPAAPVAGQAQAPAPLADPAPAPLR